MDGFVIQPYDLLMLAVLIATAVFGAYKGMAWQIAAISSVVVSCIVAIRFGGLLAPWVAAKAPWNQFIAMLVLYIGTSLLIWMLFRVIKGVIDRVQLKDFDRQMGALFGLARGLLYCLVITFFAVTLSETTRQAVLKSRSGYYTAVLIHRAAPALPEEVRDVLGQYIDQLHRQLLPRHPPEDEGVAAAQPAAGRPNLGGPADGEPTGQGQPTLQGTGHSDADVQAALEERIDEQIHELSRRAEDQLNRQLDQTARRVQEAVGRRLDELGTQVERRPLVPVDP